MTITHKAQDLTKEQWVEQEKNKILSHVSEFDIVQGFWPGGKPLKLNKGGISSPFRADEQGSFLIGTKYGPITYKDMGALEYRGDVWKFVQQIEGLQKFTDILKTIDKRFNLGLYSGKLEGVSSIVTWEQPPIEIKPPTLLQVTTRKFQKDELRYWSDYFQDIEDLKREDIYAPATIWRNRKKLPITIMTFCYYCKEINKWKLYRPYAQKRTKNTPPWEWKWDNSINSLEYIEGLDKMRGPIGIVTKSRKDAMCWRKLTGIDAVCSIQAEDPSAVTDEALYHIQSHVTYKVSAMDNDEKGKIMSWWMSSRGYNHVNVPDKLREEEGITDFADYTRLYGIEEVRKYLKSKWII